MPVEDKPVHPKTVFSGRYGCHGREDFADGYMAPDGYAEVMDDARGWLDARIKLAYVPHRMSRECRYDQSHIDSACAGCAQVGRGRVYAEAVAARANAKVSGAGTASAGLPGYAGDNNGERK